MEIQNLQWLGRNKKPSLFKFCDFVNHKNLTHFNVTESESLTINIDGSTKTIPLNHYLNKMNGEFFVSEKNHTTK